MNYRIGALDLYFSQASPRRPVKSYASSSFILSSRNCLFCVGRTLEWISTRSRAIDLGSKLEYLDDITISSSDGMELPRC